MTATKQLFDYDGRFGGIVAGMDEAGRGPLAGPVVCACCIMGNKYIDGINDSKKLSETKREKLYGEIIGAAVCYGVGIVENDVIDEINILNATKLGMKRAFENMGNSPDILLVDGPQLPDILCRMRAVVKGDETSYAIAAASIIAKVTRDRLLIQYAKKYPQYGFESHKGYGTAEHYSALRLYGALPIHRKSFLKDFIRQGSIE